MNESAARGQRLRAARKNASLSVAQLAKRTGISESGIRAIENGQNDLRPVNAEKLGPPLGVTPAYLLTGVGAPAPTRASEVFVPIIGRVGADADNCFLYTTADETGDVVPLPPGGSPRAVALEVCGHSMHGFANDGALLYFEDQHHAPTPDMIGQPVIVATADGRVLVKLLKRGSRDGLFDLESRNGPTIEDVTIVWAAEITAIIPPRQAERIIRRRGEHGQAPRLNQA